MAGRILQPPIKTISVVVVHLFILHSCRAQVQLIGPSKPIVVIVGDDTVLPCHLDTAVNIAAKTLEWTRPDLKPRFVNVRRAGQDLENVKNPSYSGRTSLIESELKKGNMSLKLSKVKPSDAGRYRCYIPDMETDAAVELVVASDAVSTPVISLLGTDRNKAGVTLNCESSGWYPEPEVLWLDGEGNLLSAGPTETVRGPDDLYTVSSRVTVEKRHSNSFTCRVQQKDTSQTRGTKIYVADDFFKGQSSSETIIIGLAAGLVVWIIMFVLLLVAFVLKWRPNIKTNKSEEMKALKEKEENNIEHVPHPIRPGQDSAGGHVIIEKIGSMSNHVHLRNNSDEDRSLEGWDLHLQVNNRKPIVFKFVHPYILSPGKDITIRAEGCGTTYDTETDLVWWGQEAWGPGKKLFNLYRDTGELEDSRSEPDIDHRTSQDSSKETITVYDVDPMGKYVGLFNNSDKVQDLAGWEVYIRVNNRKPIKIKTDNRFLSPGTSVTMGWEQTSWKVGDQLQVTLYNDTGEEMFTGEF